MGIEDWLKWNVFYSQLGKPSGPHGAVIGRLMTAYNAEAHDFTLAHADIGPEVRVLEIGFGGGALVRKVTELAPYSTVHGVDLSKVMMRQARKRNAAAIREGRAELQYGEVSALLYSDESFDRALSVHSVYFWPELVNDLKEVLRVLKPGALLAITVDPSEPVQPFQRSSTGFAWWNGETFLALLEAAGFIGARVDTRDDRKLACIVGRKPERRG